MKIHIIDLCQSSGDKSCLDNSFDNIQRRLFLRRSAYQKLAKEQGFSYISWNCPHCGSPNHGRPTTKTASVSSSSYENWAVIAFAPLTMTIGIDITPKRPPSEAEGIAEAFFTPGELCQRPTGGWQEGVGFSEIWAAKEALGKAQGIGLAIDHPNSPGGALDTSTHAELLSRFTGKNGLPPHLTCRAAVISR